MSDRFVIVHVSGKIAAPNRVKAFATALGELNSIRALESGWYYGQGAAVSEQVGKNASEVLRSLYEGGFEAFEAFPGVDGGITVAGYSDSHSVEVRANPDSSLRVIHEFEDQEREREDDLKLEQARQVVAELAREICWSALYIGAGTANVSNVSVARPLSRQATAVFRSSVLSVLSQLQEPSATTYSSTTPADPLIRQRIGASTGPPFLQTSPQSSMTTALAIPAT